MKAPPPSTSAAAPPRRGELYWLDFSPATGAEMRDPHPALVLQNNVANRASRLTIVAAVTSNLHVADLPVSVRLEPIDSGLSVPSVVHLGHLYTVDQRRLRRRIGTLPPALIARIDQALLVSLGLQPFGRPHAGSR